MCGILTGQCMESLQTAIKEAIILDGKFSFAVVDFDNTCIVNDVAEATLAYLCKNGLLKNLSLLPDSTNNYYERVFHRYYELLDKGDIRLAYLFCSEAFSGFTESELEAAVYETIEEEGTALTKTELYGITISHGLRVRSIVKELLGFLQTEGIDIWIVSASPESAVRAAMKQFSISGKLIGLRNKIVNGVLQSEVSEPYSIAEGKVSCIKTYIDSVQRPILGIGDSMNDFSMVEYANIHAVIDRENALSKEARSRGWHIL
jgi:phosphoserine phosphatase